MKATYDVPPVLTIDKKRLRGFLNIKVKYKKHVKNAYASDVIYVSSVERGNPISGSAPFVIGAGDPMEGEKIVRINVTSSPKGGKARVSWKGINEYLTTVSGEDSKLLQVVVK